MSDEQDGGASAREGREEHDDVGSLGDEAAKLLGALSGWARERPAGDEAGPEARHGAPGPAAGLGEQVADALHRMSEHVATDSAECRYCPVCRVVHAVRETSPEVREHLVSAAGSLLEAAAGLLATHVPSQQPDPASDGSSTHADGVQRIDLDPDGSDPDHPEDHGETR